MEACFLRRIRASVLSVVVFAGLGGACSDVPTTPDPLPIAQVLVIVADVSDSTVPPAVRRQEAVARVRSALLVDKPARLDVLLLATGTEVRQFEPTPIGGWQSYEPDDGHMQRLADGMKSEEKWLASLDSLWSESLKDATHVSPIWQSVAWAATSLRRCDEVTAAGFQCHPALAVHTDGRESRKVEVRDAIQRELHGKRPMKMKIAPLPLSGVKVSFCGGANHIREATEKGTLPIEPAALSRIWSEAVGVPVVIEPTCPVPQIAVTEGR